MKINLKDIDKIYRIDEPWFISDLECLHEEKTLKLHVEYNPEQELNCPTCDVVCDLYDHRKRVLRHTDTSDYKTVMEVNVPRVKCKKHRIAMLPIPWAERKSRFTKTMESKIISVLEETSIQAATRLLNLSWTAIDGVMKKAVKRGKSRQQGQIYKHIGIDETAFKKRHNYVTIVSDQDGKVVHVGMNRKQKTLESWYRSLSSEQLAGIQSVRMDRWKAFIGATLKQVPDAELKIAFDKFHIAKYLGDAVDKVRIKEHKELMREGYHDLKGTKYDWLRNPANMSHGDKMTFKALRESNLRTARAWAIKQLAMSLWHYINRTWAEKAWTRWLSWALRCRLEPIVKVARMIKKHLWEILNAVVLGVTNGPAESNNSKIRMVKIRSRGFRNKNRFARAIMFYLGGLDLHPA